MATIEGIAEIGPAGAAQRRRQPALSQSHWLRLVPLLLLAYSILLPQELRVNLAGQTIYPYRAVILLLAPWTFYQLLSNRHRYLMVDALALLGCGWIVIAMMVVYAPGEGFLRGMAIALDIMAPYLIGRCSILEISDFRRFLISLAPGVGLAALSLLAESAVGAPLVRPAMASIFGALPFYYGGEEVANLTLDPSFRFGLLRAAGPFSHAILAGLFFASLFPLYALSAIKGWPKKAGWISSLLGVLSWSSAAILGLLIGAVLVAYDWLQKRVEIFSWRALAAASAVSGLVIHLVSQNGIINILVRLTLDPQTGFYRLLIWRHGIESIRKHPLGGIGYAAYERPDWMSSSIDSQWLVLGVRHGLVAAVTLFAVACIAIVAVGMASLRHDELDRRLLVGFAITLFMMTLMGFTVAFFGGVLIWYFLLLGLGLTLSQLAPQQAQA